MDSRHNFGKPSLTIAMIWHDLVKAERNVVNGERHIREQRARIARAERAGFDTSMGWALLRTFEQTQVLHVGARDRLLKELADVS